MDKFNFDKVIANIEKMKVNLPKVVANDTKAYFLSSWQTSSWDGKTWKQPKRVNKKGKSSTLRSQTLVQSGTLRRAVANSLQMATWQKIYFEVKDVPYAAIHNDGLNMKNGQPMPQRRFMGQTNKLKQIQLAAIKRYSDKVWQG